MELDLFGKEIGQPNNGQSPNSDSGFQRVCLEQNLGLKGSNSQAYGGFPGKFESTNLSLEILSWRLAALLLGEP